MARHFRKVEATAEIHIRVKVVDKEMWLRLASEADLTLTDWITSQLRLLSLEINAAAKGRRKK